MLTCPKCGKSNTDDAIYCSNCGASLGSSSQPMVPKTFQQEASTTSPPSTATSAQALSRVNARGLPERLEKALRRAELLSYAAIGLSVVILVLTLVITFG